MGASKHTPIWQLVLLSLLVVGIVLTALVFVGGLVKVIFFSNRPPPAAVHSIKPDNTGTPSRSANAR